MDNTGYDNSEQILKNRASEYLNNGTKNAQYIDMSFPDPYSMNRESLGVLSVGRRSTYMCNMFYVTIFIISI